MRLVLPPPYVVLAGRLDTSPEFPRTVPCYQVMTSMMTAAPTATYVRKNLFETYIRITKHHPSFHKDNLFDFIVEHVNRQHDQTNVVSIYTRRGYRTVFKCRWLCKSKLLYRVCVACLLSCMLLWNFLPRWETNT